MEPSPALTARYDLKNLTREETRAALVEMGAPRFHGDQVFRWVHGRSVETTEAMTDLALPLRARLARETSISRLAIDSVQVSTDGTRKMAFRTADGRLIESVLIPDGDAGADGADNDEGEEELEASEASEANQGSEALEASRPISASMWNGGRKDSREAAAPGLFARRKKLTLCISSQVGCALDCRFCATASLGFGRNLTAGEIVDQVYRASELLKALPDSDPTRRAGADHVTNIVFMGMGEPLHNFAEVERSLAMLTDQRGMSFSTRRITVSTAGLVPALLKFGRAPVRANLAVSLNATTDAVRDEIMPINRKWKIASLLEAVRAFPLERRRRVTFEYVLLAGVNDSLADARRLPELLRGIPSKVNLIPWNPHPLSDYQRPSDAVINAFHAELRRQDMAVYVRRSRGRDIDAACGQLAAKKETPIVTLRRA